VHRDVDREAGPTIPGLADLPPPPEDEGEVGSEEDDIVVGSDGRRFRRIDANDWFSARSLDEAVVSYRRYGHSLGASSAGLTMDSPYHDTDLSGLASMLKPEKIREVGVPKRKLRALSFRAKKPMKPRPTR
jgi:hypothetical protein